jgi:hypothetical protein
MMTSFAMPVNVHRKDWQGWEERKVHFPFRSCLRVDLYPSVNFPDFMTSASRELIDSAAFFDFLGGMVGDWLGFTEGSLEWR